MDVTALQRRTLWTVTVSQMFGGAGLAAGVTVGALLAKDMLGGDSVAGLPVALFTLGSALAAFLVGRCTQLWGRRLGLGAGFAVGAVGALGVIAAAAVDSVAFLMVALFVYGSGSATNLQARYAGTDLAEPEHRARAVSVALVSTTLGAVAGPVAVEPMGMIAEALGLPSLTGAFVLAAVAYALAGIVLFVFLRPDPFLIARSLSAAGEGLADDDPPQGGDAHRGDNASAQKASKLGYSGRIAVRVGAGAYLGAVVMLVTQMVMIAVMTMTPVHMQDHGLGLGDVGLVIGFHIGAMYLPSPIVGTMVDRFGRAPMVIASAVTLLGAGVIAAVAPGGSLVAVILALTLLGLGWNIGLIAGTALVVDATEPAQRPRIQGTIDVTIALAGAGGGVLSGVVVAQANYATLTLMGGAFALILIPALAIWRRQLIPSR